MLKAEIAAVYLKILKPLEGPKFKQREYPKTNPPPRHIEFNVSKLCIKYIRC